MNSSVNKTLDTWIGLVGMFVAGIVLYGIETIKNLISQPFHVRQI